MKRLYVFASVALAGTILLVEYDLSQRIQIRNLKAKGTPSVAGQTAFAKPVQKINQQSEIAPKELTQAVDDSFFESATLKSAQKLSSKQTDPRTLDKKMDELAKSLSSLEIKKLAIIAFNKNETEDRRAMAVEILSRSKTPDAVLMLKEFVVSKQTSTAGNAQKRQLESVLRAQAIEGIAGYPQRDLALSYLNSLAAQVDETFLKDRIVRSEEGIKGRFSKSQKKEDAALKQLVQ